MGKPTKRTYLYIDGFNLYYRAAKPNNIKWLNVVELCRQKLHADNRIDKAKYFTAPVKGDARVRQRIFLRALQTLPGLEIIEGTFHTQKDYRLLADKPDTKVRVVLPEEKGSDVNLAVNIIDDAHRDLFDLAVLVTNDSDQIGAIQAVRRIGKLVGVICPSPKVTKPLKQAATFVRHITRNDLVKAEFPPMLTDDQGEFYRPRSWK